MAYINGYALRLAGVVSSLAFGLPLAGSAAPRQKLTGHCVPAAVAHMLPAGSLPGSQRLNLAIGLPLRNEQELDALLQQLYDPASTNYHHYLTPAEFAARFGPAENDYQALKDFAKSNGLEVTATHPNRVVLDVSGTVTDIEKTFHLTLRVYQHPKEARTFCAPDVEPSLDFAVPILHISGLDNYSLPHPNFKVVPPGAVANATPNVGSGPGGSYRGSDFRTAYFPGMTLTGSGQSVGLLEFDGFYPGDITTYESQAGLPNVPLTVVRVNGGVGTPGTGNQEVSLDIEMLISMAPGLSRIYAFEAPNPSPWEDLLITMVSYTNIHQFSSSWTVGSPNPTAEQIFKQMGAQGQSFFNASGDFDAYTNGIPFPSDSPNITVVGGTVLAMNGTGASYASETVWNERTVNPHGGNWGSSGGISTNYPIPLYQQSISISTSQGSTTMRNVPDVALTAENIYVVYGNGKTNTAGGGTSAAAPLWAGFTALVNQQAAAAGLAPVGFLNPALYAIGMSADYTTAFHDITTGDNTWSGSSNLFFAVPGYDLCTGWGTPNGTNLINLLTVLRPPWIFFQPQSQTVDAGSSASFRVIARGREPLNYQWFLNDQPIPTATGSNYSIARVQSIQAGTYTVVVSNSYGSVPSAPATLAITPGSGAFGIVGAPFSYQIVADNSPTWYSASGLPPGFLCDGPTGVIYGTPTGAGTYLVHVEARNLFESVSATILFTIVDGAITETSAGGIVGVPFSYQIVADNSPTWYSASGLPPGFLCDGPTGVIYGTPGGAGTYSVHVEARNLFESASGTIPITVNHGAITETSADGIVGVPFSYQIVADNNPTWYLASGLPPGFLCDGPTGVIYGTPGGAGTYSVHVEARNLFESISATIPIAINHGTITGGTGTQPTLTISRTGDNVLLTWPVTSDGVTLEEIQLQQTTWTNSSANVVIQGNQGVAIIPIQSTAKFYRLRK